MLKFILGEVFPVIMSFVLGVIGFWGIYKFNKQQPKEEQ